jgi:hypothetical protein
MLGLRDRWNLLKDIAIAMGLAAIVFTPILVVSGHLPPRGLVTGTVYTANFPAPAVKLAFASSTVSDVVTDAGGHYSATLPPATYHVSADSVSLGLSWHLGPGLSDFGPLNVVVTAGGQVTADFGVFPRGTGLAICLAAGARIATPAGLVSVSDLHPGMVVWTVDRAGARIAAPILQVSHVPAPSGHHVVRLVLSDGRVVEASAGHPTADGRTVGQLRPGDLLDGSRVSAVERIAYAGETWDLLPEGPSGVYWADGVPLLSTMFTRS